MPSHRSCQGASSPSQKMASFKAQPSGQLPACFVFARRRIQPGSDPESCTAGTSTRVVSTGADFVHAAAQCSTAAACHESCS